MGGDNTREYPKIFDEFEGPAKDGQPPRKYWIQDAPEEMFDEIVEYFVTGFIKDEPICKYLNGSSDEQSNQTTRKMHRHLLEEKVSLVCLTKNENGETVLAGFNVLSIASKDDKLSDVNVDGWFINFILKLFNHLDEQRNIFKELGVDKCMKAMGLFVLPKYRGEGLGWRLLKARFPLCKSLGIKVTSTVFTSIISQKQAYKAGFEDYYSIDYDELGRNKPEFNIPNIQEHTKAVKILYKRID